MITVRKAIEELGKFPMTAKVHAYEGEMTGIVIKERRGKASFMLGYISASELDDEAEEKMAANHEAE